MIPQVIDLFISRNALVEFGLAGALILNRITHSINEHMANPARYRDQYFVNGRWWMQNSYEEFRRWFCGEVDDVVSVRSIRRAVMALEASGILIADAVNASRGDSSKWYSIDEDKYCQFMGFKTTPLANLATPPVDSLATPGVQFDLLPVSNLATSPLYSLPKSPTRTHRETPEFVAEAEAAACVEQQPQANELVGMRPRMGKQPIVTGQPPTANELKLGEQWLSHALAQHRADGGLTVPRAWTSEAFARDIARLKREASLSDVEIAMIIKFLPDDKVWCVAAMRPGTLLDISKSNGRLKVHNLIAKVRQSKQVKSVQLDARVAAIQAARREKARAEGRA